MNGIGGSKGLGLLELLVGLTLSGLLAAGAMSLLGSSQVLHRDVEIRSSMQQSTRIAMEQVQRDLTITGVGLAPMIAIFPKIVPREDGGVEIHHNVSGTATLLTRTAWLTSTLSVASSAGFEVGHEVALYDASGAIDTAIVLAVEPGKLRLNRFLTRAYRVSEGAAVTRVQTVSYWQGEIDGGQVLIRQADGQPAAPLVRNVGEFSVAYYDDPTSWVPFVPADAQDLARIRVVEIRLVVVPDDSRLIDAAMPNVVLRTRITPRSLALS